MLWIYRIICGYLKVEFYGDYKERILSLCAANGITLWNSKFTGGGIESCILVRDFKYMRKIARGKGVRVHILKKLGFPFVAQRYRKRFGILVGVALFFLILELMSGYIWIIDINGNHRVPDKEILAACNSIGIHEGIKKDSIYPKIEREKLLLKLDEIAWASLNIEGSRLTVNVTETKEKQNNNKSYSNLKATADGIIEKIDIVSGTSVVKVGDAVKKGDLLVSGIIETADDTRFVNSKGTVNAKIERTVILSENFKQKIAVPTGKVKNKTVLEFFGFKTPLYLGAEDKPYEASAKTVTAKLFSQNLPIRLYKKRFEFYNEREVAYNYDELCSMLEKRLQEEIEGLDIESYKILKKDFSKTDSEVMLKTVIESKENIAYEDILLINAGNQRQNVVK